MNLKNNKSGWIVLLIVFILLIILYIVLFVLPLNTHADTSMVQYCYSIPTPSLTLTPTPTAGPSGTMNNGQGVQPNNPSTNTTSTPGSATCNIPFKAPTLPLFTRISPTEINLLWGGSTDNPDNQAINYGYSPQDIIYGAILPSTSTSYTVGDLTPNKGIWVQVCAYKNGCAECTSLIDP